MCACTISAECAARRGNFEIPKEPELISHQRKVIIKKQVYHSDQYNWTSIMFCGIFKKLCCTPELFSAQRTASMVTWGIMCARTYVGRKGRIIAAA